MNTDFVPVAFVPAVPVVDVLTFNNAFNLQPLYVKLQSLYPWLPAFEKQRFTAYQQELPPFIVRVDPLNDEYLLGIPYPAVDSHGTELSMTCIFGTNWEAESTGTLPADCTRALSLATLYCQANGYGNPVSIGYSSNRDQMFTPARMISLQN